MRLYKKKFTQWNLNAKELTYNKTQHIRGNDDGKGNEKERRKRIREKEKQ